jgi:selenocysteine-specific elongation factor
VHVVATAGHVDHGKSTLVRALTGTDPDRLAEEHARGLSIELGYAWTTLPPVGEVAFVDVPGHERFVSTMLSGIGPVPAVLLVAAADDPWMPQAAEHLAALDALGVAHGVVAVTRSDLADPTPMLDRARAEIARTTLAGSPVVAVSAATGAGLEELRGHLVAMLTGLPTPDPAADVRLWVDRCFHVRGAGTVVTGTLPAGRIAPGDALAVGDSRLRVRSVQSLGRPVESAVGVARVALNLAGEQRELLDRHSVLVTPDAWRPTDVVDVRVVSTGATTEGGSDTGSEPPQRPLLHLGAVAVAAYHRPLGGGVSRLTLERPMPLRVGDRALLRDPGRRRLWGLTVLDPAPPPLTRRGAARERAAALADHDGVPELSAEVGRRGIVHRDLLRRIGVPWAGAVAVTPDGWLFSPQYARAVRGPLAELVSSHDAEEHADPGLPLAALADRLGVPSPHVVAALVEPPLRLVSGRVSARDDDARGTRLPDPVERGVVTLEKELAEAPFAAPTAGRLQELGLHPKAVTVAARAKRLLHLGDGVVLLPGADDLALELLAELPQPFTTSEARVRLGTSRRVVLPVLALLDRQGRTRRNPDDTRAVVVRV